MLLTPFMLPEILLHIDTLQTLKNLSNTCKTFNAALKCNPCDKQWMVAAKKICGSEFWTDKPLPGQPHADDKRYNAFLRITPWLSKPLKIQADFCKKIEKAESKLCHIYYFEPLKTATDRGMKVKIWVDGYSTLEGHDTSHTVYTNARPFGPRFTLEQTHGEVELGMLECEKQILAEINALNIPSICIRGKRFDRVTKIHQNAYAAQLSHSDDTEPHDKGTRLMIFAPNPLRLLHHVARPYKMLSDGSYSFGLGEMWTSGMQDAADESSMYYFGPRRDKATKIDPSHGRGGTAFWAAGNGDVDSAVRILRSHGLPLKSQCPITGYTILHIAAATNNAGAVERLVKRYKMGVDVRNSYGFAPINVASYHGFHQITHLLEKLGAKGCKHSWGPWRWPCEKDHDVKMLQSLVGEM